MIRTLQRLFLYLFFFSLNFEVWDPLNTNGFFSIAKLTGILYFLVSIPRVITIRTREKDRPIIITIWVFFATLLVVNAFHAESIRDNVFDSTIFQNIILFWILINHEDIEQKILEKGLLFMALGSVALSLLYFFGIGIEYYEGRVTIFGDNQNIIGMRMCISIVILLLIVIQNDLQLNKLRYILVIPIPIMLKLLISTGSRLAILSFVLAFLVGVFLFRTPEYKSKMMVFIVGLISLFVIWQITIHNEVIRTRLFESIAEGNLSNRDYIWKSLIPTIKSNPVFGLGQSGYTRFCMSTFGVYTSPHNVILEVLCFTGSVGLIIYFYFLYLIFRKSMKVYRMTGRLLPVLLLIILFSMIVVSHIIEVKMGWAILAYAASVDHLNPDPDALINQPTHENPLCN